MNDTDEVPTTSNLTAVDGGSSPYRVVVIYPPTPEPTIHCLLTTMGLVSLLTLSICGNFSQLALQYYSGRLRIGKSDSSPNGTQLYIGALYIVQFCTALSLPSVIVDHLVQIWMFGTITCLSHFVLVSVGRTASAWLIVMLFYDQTVINSSPKPSERRQKRIFAHSMFLVTILSMIAVLPAMKYIELVEDVIQTEHVNEMMIRIRTFKCLTSFGRDTYRLWINAIEFCIDYVMPLAMCTVLCVHLLWYHRTHRVRAKVLQKKMQRIRMLVAFMFFVCHFPHWMAVSCVIFSDYLQVQIPDWQTQTLGDAALFGPYIMPAVMWLPLSILSSASYTQTKFYGNPTTIVSAACTSTYSIAPNLKVKPRQNSTPSETSLLKYETRSRTLSLTNLHKTTKQQIKKPLKYIHMRSTSTIQAIRRQNAIDLASGTPTHSSGRQSISSGGSASVKAKLVKKGHLPSKLPRMITVDVTAV